MARRLVLVALILAITTNTMVVGCDGLGVLGSVLGFGGGGGSVWASLLVIPVQIIGALLLDALIGPLLGDEAGD